MSALFAQKNLARKNKNSISLSIIFKMQLLKNIKNQLYQYNLILMKNQVAIIIKK